MELTRARYWAVTLTPRLTPGLTIMELLSSLSFRLGVSFSGWTVKRSYHDVQPRVRRRACVDKHRTITPSRLKHSRSSRSTSHITVTRTALRELCVDPPILCTVVHQIHSSETGLHYLMGTVIHVACQATGEKGIPEGNYFRRQERCRACRGLEAAYEGAGVWGRIEDLGGGAVRGLIGRLGLGGPGY
jgi:hypothetical protein